MSPRRGWLTLASLMVAMLVAGAFAAPRPAVATAGAQPGATLVVGVFCAEGESVGRFVITLTRDGAVVGSPQTVPCRSQGAAEATFGGLAPGTYTVTESAGPGTDLANYATSWRCGGVSEFRTGTSFSVDLAGGSQTTCAFLNRLVRIGTLEVFKECPGRATQGRFRLSLAGTDLEFAMGCGSRELVRLPPGTYTVAETAGPGTDLADYQTVIWCLAGRLGPVSVGGTRVGGVVVRHNEVTVCRVINIYLRPF